MESVSTVGASGYWSCCCCCDHGRWWGGRRLGTNVALLKSVKASNFATDNRGTWKALSSTRCRNFPRLASLCAITLSRSLRLEIHRKYHDLKERPRSSWKCLSSLSDRGLHLFKTSLRRYPLVFYPLAYAFSRSVNKVPTMALLFWYIAGAHGIPININ